jgi:glutamate/tyrosine decarboxylase-like PLP-dependent enzyme
MFPEIRSQGYCNFGKRLIVYTSTAGHYSIDKTAMALGIGLDNVIKVLCDDEGKMIPDELGKLCGPNCSFGIYF